MSSLMVFLAQAATAPTSQPPSWYQALKQGGMMPILIGMLIVWMFLLRPKQGQDKESAERLKTLKRGDRIQTIGGILGTVVDARDDEVVIKVDETNNVKMKFIRKAISHVLPEEKTAGK